MTVTQPTETNRRAASPLPACRGVSGGRRGLQKALCRRGGEIAANAEATRTLTVRWASA